MYHQSGFCGCFSVWEPVFAIVDHWGGLIASMFSFRYLASFWMSWDAGTSLGVIKLSCPLGVSFCRIMKRDIKAFTFGFCIR